MKRTIFFRKNTRIESNSEEKPQSMALQDALKQNNSEDELADRVKKKGRIKPKKGTIEVSVEKNQPLISNLLHTPPEATVC